MARLRSRDPLDRRGPARTGAADPAAGGADGGAAGLSPGLGWLGTGRMGAALAGRLIDAGQRVTVWNRTPAKTGPLVARGARAVGRITGLGGCDIVFVTASASPDLEEVVAELLDGGFGIQMFGHIAKKRAVHGEEHIRSTVDHVREGRKNNFD